MHQFIQCQIARGIHCSTEHVEYHHCSSSRRDDEPSARFSSTSSTTTRTAWWSLCTLLFLFSDKVHIYSREGRKTAAQHVMMISINHARIYLGLRASPSVCSRSSSLSRNGGLALCRQLRLVAHTPVPHVSDMPRGGALTDWPYAYLVLHLHTTPPSVTVYRARFIMMHFSQCISTTRETLDAFGLMLN